MQIYLAEGTQHTGPFALDTIKEGLRSGRLRPDQLAWYEGAPGWAPVSRLPGLEGIAPTTTAPAGPPPMPNQYQAPYHPGVPPYNPGASAYYPPPAAPRRRPRWLMVLGLIVGLIAMADGLLTLKSGLHSDSSTPSPAADASGPTDSVPPAEAASNPTTAPALPPTTAATTPPAAPGTRHYVSDRDHYSGNLAAHYVAFSFDYPADWIVNEDENDVFVEVFHYTRLPDGQEVPAESIAFAYAYSLPGTSLARTLPATGTQLLESTAAAFLGHFPGSTKTSTRGGKFGSYPAQEQFVTADGHGREPSRYFRRTVVARPDSNGPAGMYITLLGSEAAGASNAESLGKSGGLRTMEDSFRFTP